MHRSGSKVVTKTETIFIVSTTTFINKGLSFFSCMLKFHE